MESVINIVTRFLNGAVEAYCAIAEILIEYKVIFIIVAVLAVLFTRLAVANVIQVKRHDKRDWIIWGFLAFIQLMTFFLWVPWLWLTAQLLIFAMEYLWISYKDKTKKVKSAIYSSGSGIIYEDNSDRYDKNSNGENKENKRAKDGRIKVRYSKDIVHLKMFVPVFTVKFIFKVAPEATVATIGKAVATLSHHFQEYNWRQAKQKNGEKIEISSEIKISTVRAVVFDKEISDALDWYVVPLGATDVSTKATAKATPYVWMMHDPKTEGKVYDVLKQAETNSCIPAPQGFVIGQTGGGKSVLINTMLAHWVNKAKQDGQAELYLVDAKRVEFRPYESLKEVSGVAVTIDEAIELTDQFCKEMHQRNMMMEKEGIKNIPLDGHVHLNRFIDINGQLIYGDTPIEYKTADGSIHTEYAYNLRDRDDIVEVNMPEEEKEDEEKDKKPERRSISW